MRFPACQRRHLSFKAGGLYLARSPKWRLDLAVAKSAQIAASGPLRPGASNVAQFVSSPRLSKARDALTILGESIRMRIE